METKTTRDLIKSLADALQHCETLLVREGVFDGDKSDPDYGLVAEARAVLAHWAD